METSVLEFPSWKTVYTQFLRWSRQGTFEKLNQELVKLAWISKGRKPLVSGVITDSQSIKTTEKGIKGFDGGKKVKGRKRHLLVETQGLILGIFVTAANLDDREGLLGVAQIVKPILKRLQVIWADSGYRGSFSIPSRKCRIEIIKRNERGFKVLPRR